MQALIRREEDPCIQTGLHGWLHIFRLARYFLLCISILKPCMAMSCISTKERNTRRASTVGLNNLSPRKGHCSDQRRGTGTGGVIRYSEPCIGSELRAGLKKPAGTGPVTAVTGLTGPDRFRFRPVSNRPKFKF